MTLNIEFLIADFVTDFPVDALEPFVRDAEVLSTLLKIVVTVLGLCLWMILSAVIHLMDEIRTGTEGDNPRFDSHITPLKAVKPPNGLLDFPLV
ncbi:hypothetical protein [Natronomonas amylolytica]|uniref:hypothetical protein n=1 Tax=Natronomonas amylolytica TaxID=3108498 RepID=UPI00300ADBA8